MNITTVRTSPFQETFSASAETPAKAIRNFFKKLKKLGYRFTPTQRVEFAILVGFSMMERKPFDFQPLGTISIYNI